MDNETSLPKVIKRRRRHSHTFKQRVVDECRQPNTSIAEVALRHGLNLNQVHTWRRLLGSTVGGDFVRLPLPTTGEPGHSVARVCSTVRQDAPGLLLATVR
ncbi:MAG: transposase [Haliea sp.]|nr:transposase [Haliea sp.]